MSHCRIQGKHHGCRPPWRVGLGHITLCQCPASRRAKAQGYRPTLTGREAASGGVVAEDFQEGFVTPRSQQGLPTIAEMVEGIPSASQFMSGIGSFFRVARTEVMQVPSAWQNTHDTPPRSTTLSRDSPEGQRALGERSLGSHSSSPPTLGLHGTPTSFGPPPERDGQLLSQDVLQRMQALQQRAPLLYGYPARE